MGGVSSVGRISCTYRDVPPADYTFKVDTFSMLLESPSTKKYETNEFEAGGYKWKLALYPNGNKKKDVKDHISLYLVIADTDKLPLGWEVNVNFKFFVFDHIRGNYLTTEEVGKVRRFHGMKTEWGFDRFISMDTLKNVLYGFLVDDCCVFGAEVFVIKKAGKGECLTLKKELFNLSYSWRVANFSSLSKYCYYSDVFKIKGWNWKLHLYPKGELSDGQSLSLFLSVAECEKLPLNWKLYAKFKLRIKDQVKSTKHFEIEDDIWFCASDTSWGFPNFISLRKLNDLSKGFILKDAIMFEVEFSILSVINSFT